MKGIDATADDETRAEWARGLLLLGGIVIGARFAGLWVVLIAIALVVMIFLHELGHYLTAKWAGMKVTEFFLGFGPRIWSFTRGETEYGIKAIPAGAYVKIIGMHNLEELDPKDELRTYRAKPFWRRLSVAVAGSTMHFMIAFVLICIVVMGFGLESLSTTISSVNGPAKKAGLRSGDTILAVDGIRATSWEQMSDVIRTRAKKTVEVDVRRDGKPVSFEAKLGNLNPKSGDKVGYLGVIAGIDHVHGTPVDAAHQMLTATRLTFQGLGHLFSKAGVSNYVDNVTTATKSKNAGNSATNADRPLSVIGITQVGAEAAKHGVVDVLSLLFLVNMFIGIFNLTPILPFDGGHVVIAVYEKIRTMISGRRYYADVAKMLPVTYAVVLVLVLLFVTTIYMDIVNPVSLK